MTNLYSMRYRRKNYCVQFRSHLEMLCQVYAYLTRNITFLLCLLDSYIYGTVKMKVHRKITPVSISHRATSCVNTGWFHGPRDGFDIHENWLYNYVCSIVMVTPRGLLSLQRQGFIKYTNEKKLGDAFISFQKTLPSLQVKPVWAGSCVLEHGF